ncbi:MAG: hypothetical protein ACE5DN_03715 [Flavobacteriales bacterium]
MTPDDINKWRVVPRLMALASVVLGLEITHWYITLEAATKEQTAFASTVILAIVGMWKWYMETGNPQK